MTPLSIEALVAPPTPPRAAPHAPAGGGFQQIVARLVVGRAAVTTPPPLRVSPPAAPLVDPEQIVAQLTARDEVAPTPPPPAPPPPPSSSSPPPPPPPPAPAASAASDPTLDLPLDRQNLAGDDAAEEPSDAKQEQSGEEADADATGVLAWLPPSFVLPPSVRPVRPNPVSITVRATHQPPALPEQAAATAELIAQSVDLGRMGAIGDSQPALAGEWKALAAKLEAAAALPAQPQAASQPQSQAQAQPVQPQQPGLPIVPPPAAAPVLAAAIAATLGSPTDKSESPKTDDPFAVDTLALLRPGHSPVGHRIEAASGADQASIDTARAEWIETMIDKIDEFQAQRDSHSMRIRLAPDALGVVDVSIRREHGLVHVNFAAENPAARTLLADAAPRLAELAEARGLRLGDAGVGSQQPREQRPESRPVDERAPNRAPRGERADTRTTGERIA